ncbi:DHA2 family efflux MFS transporter permease subunit [Arthrobacter zhangbolii]|uniref:DHA2 family efflux MFS transporter permease subunit n=1 Tax=Arthrobacter zhangbolii TaxID=2886936 RepID=A0A9X1SB94_9MICC|nr:MDR family MFS transporter [Arthrobacter zhangbolii]MCC3274197.1 DHA2 family efflux MFS transporter permease subunit [Arthrobacter zhangbolii]UON92277.1 DHA2 family efflux MFS transporter permease subunit [Arthrobacter zhangbolii]
MSQASSAATAGEKPHAAEAPALSTKQLTGIIGALALAAFLMILNETVLTVALPSIMADFEVSAAAGQWLTTGFLLTMSVVIPTTGYLLQRFTTRSLFIFALSSFLVGTLIAVFAPGFAFLLVARIIQAVGTAIVLPLLMTTTLTLVPVRNRGAIMGLNSIVISVGPAIGPTVSGSIVSSFSWHYIFVLMLPLAVVILILGIIFIKIPSATRKLPVDVLSVILSAIAFGFLVYGISSLEHAGDNVALTVASFVIGLAALVLFVRRQVRLTRSGRELLNLTPFRNRTFTFSVAMIMIAMGTLLGTVVIIPIILQTGGGLSTMSIGLMLLPGGVAQVLVSPIFGRIYDRFGPRPVLIPGAAMLALGQWLYVTVDSDTELRVFMVIHIVFSIGLALLMTGLLSSALSAVEPRLYGHGSAIFNTGQQLGGAIGTTIFVTVMSLLSASRLESGSDLAHSLFAGAHVAFIIGGILATIGLVLAPFVKVPRQH